MEAVRSIGLGVGDLQAAAVREAALIMKRAKGDRQVAAGLVLEKLAELDLVSKEELRALSQLSKLEFEAAAGKIEARDAYLKARELHSGLIATATTGPVALALSAGSVGSYESIEEQNGTQTVVYKKSGGNWQGTLAGAGAIIGGVLGGGAGGAAIGGAVGGVVGKVVDECLA